MGLVINFPRPFRKREEEKPRKAHPFRDATRRRIRAIITAALEILDSLDHHGPPDGGGERAPRFRRRNVKSKST